MNGLQAEKVICAIEKKLKDRNKQIFTNIANFLDKSKDEKLTFSSEFEFSFIKNNKFALRLLHLYFWQPGLTAKKIKELIRKREKGIKAIFQKINRKFNCQYDNNFAQKLFLFNRRTGFWPIQFGLEYQKKSKPRLKVYLSINREEFPLKSFCDSFKLEYKILKEEFKNRKFDTMAIDFLPDGDFGFKFYPIIALNKGKLYRVDKNTSIISIKNWTRFPSGLSVDDKKVINFIELPTYLYKIIKDNNFKIHYFCEENGKKGVYFR